MTSTIERSESKPKKQKKGRKVDSPVNIGSAGTPQRRRQLPWAVLGVLLVASSILAFAMWSRQQATRISVLVAANDIDAGEVIELDDLRTASIGSDAGVRLLESTDAALVVGEVARGPIPEGTPLSELLVVESDAVPEGMAVIGAALGPGEYPTSALRAGDQVEMVRVERISGDEQSLEVLGVATVWTVEELVTGAQRELFISLLMDHDISSSAANAVSQDQFRLVLVGAGG